MLLAFKLRTRTSPAAPLLPSLKVTTSLHYGFPWWLSGKESAYQAGDRGLIHGLGRSPGEGNSSPLQYSFLENPTDRGAWWATVHAVSKSQTQLRD